MLACNIQLLGELHDAKESTECLLLNVQHRHVIVCGPFSSMVINEPLTSPRVAMFSSLLCPVLLAAGLFGGCCDVCVL